MKYKALSRVDIKVYFEYYPTVCLFYVYYNVLFTLYRIYSEKIQTYYMLMSFALYSCKQHTKPRDQHDTAIDSTSIKSRKI